jgi:hypothetical protein
MKIVSIDVIDFADINLLLGLLVQLGAILVMDIFGIVVRGEEADVVDLSPSTLLVAQQMSAATESGLETPQLERCHFDQCEVQLRMSPNLQRNARTI